MLRTLGVRTLGFAGVLGLLLAGGAPLSIGAEEKDPAVDAGSQITVSGTIEKEDAAADGESQGLALVMDDETRYSIAPGEMTKQLEDLLGQRVTVQAMVKRDGNGSVVLHVTRFQPARPERS